MGQTEITFLAAQRVPVCRHRIDKQFQDYFTLQHMTAGGVELSVAGRKWVLNGRWFWSAYPGPRIAFHAVGRSWFHRYVAFRGGRVLRWQESGLFPVPPQQVSAGPKFDARFDQMLEQIDIGGRWATLRATHLLEGLLIDLAESRGEEVGTDDLVDRVRHQLEQSLETEFPDYQTLAERLGLSERTIRRQFKSRTGLSPHQFLINLRIGRARQLLLSTDEPIKKVAEILQYRDIFYFARQFRQVTGISPARFRRSREG